MKPLVAARPLLAAALFAATLLAAHSGFAEAQAIAPEEIRLTAPGLDQPVEILKDQWGISHIYAETEHDLFFAQGYNAARDRLFQLEIWRREATGTMAEILGPRAITRDHGIRLFKFRGDLETEMRHYHPRGHEIIPAFVAGINAYIDETRRDSDLLPIEFEMLGIEPEHWTPEVVITRHRGLLGDAGTSLSYGRAVHVLGAERVRDIASFHPHQPDIELDPAIDGQHLVDHDILELYRAFRSTTSFRPEDVAPEFRADEDDFERLEAALAMETHDLERREQESLGSNNWVLSGRLAANDYPMMANDPHRAQAAPSLRYWVHLNGPGWNVQGAGEPTIPGVSIGHNDHGAWGLTVFAINHEDIFVYETHPDDPKRYRYQDRWVEMEGAAETIRVRGDEARAVELLYTRHGPVVYQDEERNIAYAVGAAWMEVGGAPYLASLRMNQATNWEEFQEACTYSHIPGENMVWADRDGNIGWQAVGIAPIRKNFSGVVPVPGDGRFEWDGFLPIDALPSAYNPPEGFIATANANLVSPFDYPHLDEATSFFWADPFRQNRVKEVLSSGRRFSLADMVALQHDYLSIPARTLVPPLRHVSSDDARTEEARRRLLAWDHVLDAESIEAGIYVAFERRLRDRVEELVVPEAAQEHIGLSMNEVLERVVGATPEFRTLGPTPVAGRDAVLVESLEAAVDDLTERLGPDMAAWHYGQEDYKHALLRHPLSPAVSPSVRERLDVGPAPRGGYSFTVGANGYGDNQTSGASFRIFVDTRDWDATLGMNTPGQVGDPDSPFYDNLFPLWAADRVFPAYFSREKIEAVAAERIQLAPSPR